MSRLAPLFALTVAVAGGNALAAGPFTLSSPDVKPGAPIAETHAYNSFGCHGDNRSPALTWTNAPAGTRSFALLVRDPDARTGGAGWWHWLVLDIPATATGLAAGAGSADGRALPAGATQVATDFGTPGWGGPCPPVGDPPHHYNFTLYALKVDKLDVPPGATTAFVGHLVNAASLGAAQLVGLYGRPQ